MNNAKMWLVVKPTVGIPLFLGAVAVGSFAVHVAVLSNPRGLLVLPQRNGLGRVNGSAALQRNRPSCPLRQTQADLPMYLEADAYGNESMRVILPDGRTATLVVDDLTSAALIE
jgi:light-harvesting protein B-800-850 alpha chain